MTANKLTEIYDPDEFATAVETRALASFARKRYLLAVYTDGVIVEDHDGYLPYSAKGGPARTKLDRDDTIAYYRNAWTLGLNEEHPLVAAKLSGGGEIAPPETAEEPPAAAPAEEPKKAKRRSPAKRTPATKKKTEEEPPPQAPPTVGDDSRVLAAVERWGEKNIEALANAVPPDLSDQLSRIEEGIGGMHARFDTLDGGQNAIGVEIDGLATGQDQIKGGLAFLAESLVNPDARDDVLGVMSMSLDELVKEGFGTAPADPE